MPQAVTIDTSTPELLRGHDIVILSPSEWKDNAVSNMQVAALLSESNRVVYVETMGSRMPRLSELRRVWQRVGRILRRTSLGGRHHGLDPRDVTIFSPLAIPLHGRFVLDWLNQKMLVSQVTRLLRRMEIQKPIVWTFSPRWEPVAEALERQCLVFHCVDALRTYDESPVFRAQFERTARAADIVFTPSMLLAQELRRLNPSSFIIGHGCGLEHLLYCDNGNEPEDLKVVPKPRVVYAGTLAKWVDYPLFIDVARRLPNLSFILISYIHALAPRSQVEALCALPNVYHLGYKDFSDLPRYYKRSAVGIVPYQADNEHIRFSTPTKFLDYFAAGLPVVSTRFPAAENLAGMVECTDTPREFASAVEKAIIDISPERVKIRRTFAEEHTWERQVARMCDHIRGHLNRD